MSSEVDLPGAKPSWKSKMAIPFLVLAGGIVAVVAWSQFLAPRGKDSSQEHTIIEETLNVDPGTFAARGFVLNEESKVSLAYDVRDGRGIDVILVTETQKREFEKAPQKPLVILQGDMLFGGKAWFYFTKISSGGQLSHYQGSLILPSGQWSIIVRSTPPEPMSDKTGAAKVYVKISVP